MPSLSHPHRKRWAELPWPSRASTLLLSSVEDQVERTEVRSEVHCHPSLGLPSPPPSPIGLLLKHDEHVESPIVVVISGYDVGDFLREGESVVGRILVCVWGQSTH